MTTLRAMLTGALLLAGSTQAWAQGPAEDVYGRVCGGGATPVLCHSVAKCDGPVAALLASAKLTVDVTGYGLARPAVLKALVAAHKRGVVVRVLAAQPVPALIKAGVRVVYQTAVREQTGDPAAPTMLVDRRGIVTTLPVPVPGLPAGGVVVASDCPAWADEDATAGFQREWKRGQ